MINRMLQLFANALLVNVAFVSSFFLRYSGDIPQKNYAPYKENFIFFTCTYLLCLTFTGTFRKRFSSFWQLFQSLFNGLFLGTFFVLVFVYIFRIYWSKFPSSIFIIQFPVCMFLLFLTNSVLLRLTRRIRRKVVVLGKSDDLEIAKSSYVEKTHINSIEELLHYEDIDEVQICSNIHDSTQMNLLIFLLLKLKVNVMFSPVIYSKLMSESMMDQNSHKFLATSIGYKSDFEDFSMRALDLICSISLLVFSIPLFFIAAVAVKMSSPGPIFYKQTRVGKDGKLFDLYKFRTMVADAEKISGPVLSSEDDPRVTRAGKFLRSTRIDELPQLLNVIKGNMSLVGPRPERSHFVKRHKALREIRLSVKPGLTGLAQIRNVYGLRPEHKIKYDYLYIQKRSTALNLYILFKTIPVVFLKKGL